ncbi:MAG: hypothetical protein Q8O00_05685 [Holophaga sp.]|nr:hypothetical protein [Holophaga sp.]
MANQEPTASKCKSILLLLLLEALAISLLFITFYWLYKVLPVHAMKFEGMGNSLPLISRIVFKNHTLSCLPLFAAIFAFGGLHLLFLKSQRAVRIALFAYALFLIATLGIFWYASRAPLWQLQKKFPQHQGTFVLCASPTNNVG